jgi:hypothetical protein
MECFDNHQQNGTCDTFGNVRNVRKYYCGKILIQINIDVEKRSVLIEKRACT